MADVKEFIGDVQKYDAGADEAVVGKIVRHLGIALQKNNAGNLTDSGLVAASDKTELDRVRDRWAIKKLGLDEDTGGKLVKEVAEEMKGDRLKNRVTFYYLVAKKAGKLDAL
jgi:Protein of unknown function (DUF2853)